jgi:MFS family permease
LVARGLDRFGKGIRTTARDALISELAPKDRMGEAFGLHRALDTAGAFCGVLVTLGLLYFFPGQYRLIFILAIVPGIVSVLAIRPVKEAPGHTEPTRWSPAELKTLPYGYWHALVITVLFALANSSDTFLLLRAKKAGHGDLEIVLMYALFNVVYAALSYPTGKLSDTVGRRPIIAFGWAMYGLVYLGFAFWSGNMFWLLFAGYGLYQGFADGASKALVADYSPKEHKGAAMGFFYMCAGFGTLAGNLVGGLLWDRIDPATMFRLDAILALIAAGGLLTLKRKRETK